MGKAGNVEGGWEGGRKPLKIKNAVRAEATALTDADRSSVSEMSIFTTRKNTF